MYTMTIIRRLRSRLTFGILCLALGLTQGCARSEPLHRSDAADEKKLPFHTDSDQASDGEGPSLTTASDPKQATALPFKAGSHTRILPSGMLLTVQLNDSLSGAKVRAGDVFTASIAAPLWLGRDMVLERGATVTGRVESAQLQANRSGLPQDLRYPGAGYFRLTLSEITVEGRQLALQTSSLFARGTFQVPEGIGVQKGRRLTFRLTAPVAIDAPNSVADRQSVDLTVE
jgi:hypothetical protein